MGVKSDVPMVLLYVHPIKTFDDNQYELTHNFEWSYDPQTTVFKCSEKLHKLISSAILKNTFINENEEYNYPSSTFSMSPD